MSAREPRLLAWFPQGGVLEVKVPEGGDAESYCQEIREGEHPWVELIDGTYANVVQVLRLEVND